MSSFPSLPPGHTADVALLLEGTYPFVSGGVSSWVHQIISNFPELTFALIFIGSSRSAYGAPRYTLPPNVVHVQCAYLDEPPSSGPVRRCPASRAAFDDSAQLHEALRVPQVRMDPEVYTRVMQGIGQPDVLPARAFLHSERAWEQLREGWEQSCSDGSFVDYFWTVRSMHAPLFTLAHLAESIPPVRVAHAISTGYAGFLGALLQQRRGLPFILSEHGIYTKERKIELIRAEWIHDAPDLFGPPVQEGMGPLRRLWIRFFAGLGKLTYEAAHPIVSLYEGNRQRQILDGAAAERTVVVPNGVTLPRFSALRAARPVEVPPVLGLLGRVVPIKDIRTFIRTMRLVCTRLPQAEGWIIGPENEDAAYAQECRCLVESLGLTNQVKFLGFQKPDEVLPKLGVLMLTSISEALPLVLLEGFASGLPAVATDVGSCRELIEGNTPEDRALGAAGCVVPIADPEATARAALELLTSPGRWQAAQAAGMARVERFYDEQRMFDSYRAIYQGALGGDGGGDRVRAAQASTG
ncbi:GT4 family glycosyltransferase PelF [Stigmatella sp. ncwal1]|uniref:GT4 family glycosyltransferase PelF n=1 Tax=Stigmatella ashevillensis TaxID=2995309 RepID=A0ABT5D135_9BACT|nr:GT4 family glycosyltransferase PelF [Stigmatella ashevillena]MDC0707370.1 GT4 family glycosyltransferase PelF [Stigmatella ashevillena]